MVLSAVAVTSIVLCGVASVGAVTLMPSCGVALMVAYGFALVVAQEAFCRDRDDSSLDVDVCYKHCAVRCEGDVAFGDGFEANRDWLGGDVEAFPLSLFFMLSTPLVRLTPGWVPSS
ncbi:Uncharacterised protein [Corynebacterium diphtheriae]|nr:Uncharacterised protein [Corynebacterium diphtheriae]